jgi:hypothetical protein
MTSLIESPRITTPEIEHAEKAVISAQQVAADLKLAAASRAERLQHLRVRRAAIATRLAKLESRDIGTARVYYTAIVAELLDSSAVETEHARKLELSNALKCLGELRELSELLPGIIATVKGERDRADAELAELEK